MAGTELGVTLLGGFAVEVGGRTIPIHTFRSQKGQNLLKLLALAPDHRLHREQLLDALWPDAAPAAAINSLHATLHGLRRTLQPELRAGRDAAFCRLHAGHVLLAPGGSVWTDVGAFESAARDALRSRNPDLYEQAAALYRGDLLPLDLYDDWVIQPRETLRTTFLTLLRGWARVLEAREDRERAVEVLARIVQVDPVDEDAHVALMRYFAATGRRQRALQQYGRLSEALHRELEIAPGKEAEELYRALLSRVEYPELRPVPFPDIPHNLPSPVSRFIGREAERAEVEVLLADGRLLTITGPGGSGKTRLAIETAWAVRHRFPDGVWFIELGEVTDERMTADTVARGVGLAGTADAAGALVGWARERTCLLILDNCEHLVAAAATLAERLLQAAPGLTVMATSRIALDLAGEIVWRLPAMSADNDALALFADRARLRQPAFQITDDNRSTITAICRRLDGLPLAIELAAALLAALSPESILNRLGDRFQLLVNGSRTAVLRQSTLRATLDWSYGLLGERERLLFRRLAIFAGSFTLETVEDVCTGEDLPPSSVLPAVTSLVDQSLVSLAEGRYVLLESVRSYGLEKLQAAGEEDGLRARAAAHALELAESARAGMRTGNPATWLDVLEREHENVRAALGWLISHDAAVHARLAAALVRFWVTRGHLREGLIHLCSAVEGATQSDTEAQAAYGAGLIATKLSDHALAERMLRRASRAFSEQGNTRMAALALNALGGLHLERAEWDAAATHYAESVRLLRTVDDRENLSLVLNNLAAIHTMQGAYDQAETLYQESLSHAVPAAAAHALYGLGNIAFYRAHYGQAEDLYTHSLTQLEALGDIVTALYVRTNLAQTALDSGSPDRAAGFLEPVLAERRAMGDKRGAAIAGMVLGRVALSHGADNEAREHLGRSLSLARETADRWTEAQTHLSLSAVVRRAEDSSAALHHARTALAGARDMGDVHLTALSLEEIAFSTTPSVGAVTCLAAAAALRSRIGSPPSLPQRPLVEQAGRENRLALGAGYREVWDRGTRTDLSRVIELVLAADAPFRRVETARVVDLTRREMDVARLVALGKTNREIAADLHLSHRTVDTHVSRILRRLGAARREDIAGLLAGGSRTYPDAPSRATYT